MDDALGAAGWKDPLEIRYTVQYRGEGEGIYDYGPRSTATRARSCAASASTSRHWCARVAN
jgi:hypothetical protein